MSKFKSGDRIKGLGFYEGKVGTIYRVIDSEGLVVNWDDNPFRVIVETSDVEVLKINE